MMDNTPPEDAQDLWQNQEPEQMTITLEEVRVRAARLQRHARVILIASLVGLLVLVINTIFGFDRVGLIPRAGWGTVLLVLFYTSYRSYKAGRRALNEFGGTASVHFYQHELERRINSPRTVLLIGGGTAWGMILAFESGRPLANWIPFFVILAISGVSHHFTRRDEVQKLKADLEAVKLLIAKQQ